MIFAFNLSKGAIGQVQHLLSWCRLQNFPNPSEIVLGFSIVRIQLDGCFEVLSRLDEIPSLSQGEPNVIVCLGVVWS